MFLNFENSFIQTSSDKACVFDNNANDITLNTLNLNSNKNLSLSL